MVLKGDSPLNEPPVRLCCGQRHWTAQCPDGKVMCQLCFDRFDIEDLNMVNGQREDVCTSCATAEAKEMVRRGLSL